MTVANTRYYLRLDIEGAPEIEVSKEQWVRAERAAGFWGQDWDEPCTTGFSGHGVCGRIGHGEGVPPHQTDSILRFMRETISYSISLDGKAIFCRMCGRSSVNPGDIENMYCGHCHMFHDNRKLEEWLKPQGEQKP